MPKMCAIPQLLSPPLDAFIIYSHYVSLSMSRNIVCFGYIMVCMRHEMYISCGFSSIALSLIQVLWSPSLLKVVGFLLVLTTENHERRLKETKTQAKCFFLPESLEKMM